ncbi:spermatogenesis-associated protein 17-like [Synchiropus splendidus]|uniref:spermatogenesis-associated protein 17-like n=1 Tax=Synchiropus splendidus TaxID=270530 RepID=UPI00237E80A7|nr:spermatogenesis-associated protein 17-like [Synchiropus splendidus]
MADLLKINSEVNEFQTHFFVRSCLAEDNRVKEIHAATQIQSWFRASRIRSYLRHLHRKATIIQKFWRGFTARALFREIIRTQYFVMKMIVYNQMAVRIQKTWKGYFVRKFVLNFYVRRSYLEALAVKNEIVRRELNQLEELHMREKECLEEIKERKAKIYNAHHMHHHLSTQTQAGIYNSPFREAPHKMELLLRQVKYKTPTKVPHRGQAARTASISPGSSCLKTSRSLKNGLPPPPATMKQGPRPQPGEVWEQRICLPELTSQLQSTYRSLRWTQKELQQHEATILSEGKETKLLCLNGNTLVPPDLTRTCR